MPGILTMHETRLVGRVAKIPLTPTPMLFHPENQNINRTKSKHVKSDA
jgi:hypothetical protein